MENQKEVEFDLMQLVRYLFRRVWIILLITATFAGAGYVISKETTVPQYSTSCRIYIYKKEANLGYNDVLVSLFLRNDCRIMITGYNVSERVVEDLNLNISPEALSSRIKVIAEDDSRILEISYTDTNPQRAADVLNKVCEVASEQIMTHMKLDAVTVIYPAKVPTTPTATDLTRDTVIAAAVGFVLSAGVLIVLFLLDDTIRSEDDVDRYLGVSTLAAIPVSAELASDGRPIDTNKKKGLARFIRK